MSEMPWVRFFPSDWLGGTRSMSAAETGIYITLIATMYEKGEPIKEDAQRLSRLCGASNSSFKTCLESLIADGKVVRTSDGLWNERVQKETVYRQEKSEVGSRAAKTKWDRKRNENNANTHATAMPSQSDRNANQKPQPDTIKKEDTSLRSVTREPDEFESWYLHFPNKVGKEAARKAWPKARKQASYEQLCGGLRRYLNKTDDRPWCNPATWLNQGRWLDEPPSQAAAKPKGAELFFVEAERLKNERNARQPWDDVDSDRRDANGFPILELEYKPRDR